MDPVECSHQGLLAYKDGALEDAIVLFSRGIQLTPPSRPKFASKLLKDRADWERLTVADPGERPAPPPLIFGPNLGPKGRKKFFWRPPPLLLDDRGPHYLKVWIWH